eukprot:GHUV01039273.1.p1 GENE.GHUV01039273.1~~GHUV01039273.1.p1  ORF type:complete len:113 (-),score=34.02 GHUV01039273.1:7-345(-)
MPVGVHVLVFMTLSAGVHGRVLSCHMQALTAAQQHSNLAKVDIVAGIVSSLDQQLKATQKEAEQLNAREGLLGKPMTDYRNIKQLADQFDPFIQFWTATATWKVCTWLSWLL